MTTLNKTYGKADIARSSSFFGNTFRILKSPAKYLGELTKAYGSIVVVHFAGKKYFIIQHPDYIKHVLIENHTAYYKPGATQIMRLFLGEGLMTSNGELWSKQRKLMQPAFH